MPIGRPKPGECQPRPVKVIVVCQESLVRIHTPGGGEWATVMCRKVAEVMLGRRLKAGETVTGDISFCPDQTSP